MAIAASTAFDFPDTGSPMAMVGGTPLMNYATVRSERPWPPHQVQAVQHVCHRQRMSASGAPSALDFLLYPDHLKKYQVLIVR